MEAYCEIFVDADATFAGPTWRDVVVHTAIIHSRFPSQTVNFLAHANDDLLLDLKEDIALRLPIGERGQVTASVMLPLDVTTDVFDPGHPTQIWWLAPNGQRVDLSECEHTVGLTDAIERAGDECIEEEKNREL